MLPPNPLPPISHEAEVAARRAADALAVKVARAARRKTERAAADFYPTPLWVIDAFLDRHPPPSGLYVVEPACGDGRLVSALVRRGYTTVCADIRAEAVDAGMGCGAVFGKQMDWIADGPTFCSQFNVGALITNPPYSVATEFLDVCLKQCPSLEYIALLLRLGMLASLRRAAFWQQHPPSRLFPLARRPSFRGGGTDQTEYAWFVWSRASTAMAVDVLLPPEK